MRRPSNFLVLAIALVALSGMVLTSCSQKPTDPGQHLMAANLLNNSQMTVNKPFVTQAYYDSMFFNIMLTLMPANADSAILYHNGQINNIWMFEPGDSGFVFVIDAVPGDGMNPMWREVEIHFNPGFTPHQFYSDNEVLAAAGGQNPEITLVNTNEIYRCSIIGRKP